MNDKVRDTLSGLKDFQLETVDYVYDRIYNHGQNKMLIADEVGLGKTLIAKGIIAKAFQQFLDRTDKKKKQFRVVYICSNLALASQNIKKLNFWGADAVMETDISRLTYLCFNSDEEDKSQFKISSLTPGTSFDTKNKYGEATERAVIFSLLAHYAPFYNRWNGLRWLLKGNKDIIRWDGTIRYYYDNRLTEFRRDIFTSYRDKLNAYILTREKEPQLFEYFGRKETISMWHALMDICDDLTGKNINRFEHSAELVSTLRRLLSQECVKYLNADIFILDEFQRYNQLIKWEQEEQPPAVEMAKAVFSIEDAKILMLSATPFKAYTNDFDELNGEVHYSEFKSVLQFLMQGKSKEFWHDYEQNRKAFTKIICDSNNWKNRTEDIKSSKKSLEDLYKTVMVRTERSLVSSDGNALISDMLKNETLSISTEDVQDFINLDKICQKLNTIAYSRLPVPVEYVKSTPYALSFLDKYQLKIKLSKAIEEDEELKELVKSNKDAFVSKKDIENYKPIISEKGAKLPNAKIRKLLEIDLEKEGWKLLWIPPTLPYYSLDGAFRNSFHFTKTLIFSSWVMVPRMIATVLSYEAERRSIGSLLASNKIEKEERLNYFDKPRSPKPQFTFRTLQGEDPKQLSNFTLLYPCLSLANLYNPKENLNSKLSIEEIKKVLFNKIKSLLDSVNIRQYATEQAEIDKWFWAAPVLLDKLLSKYRSEISDWLNESENQENISIDTEASERDTTENVGRETHFKALKSFFFSENISMPVLTDEKYTELITYLVDYTIASPGVCFTRAFNNYFSAVSENAKFAFNASLAFLSLFNKPESIAVIRLTVDKKPYWSQVLRYCIDGNFQSMIDEFIYLLFDCENLREVKTIVQHISDILTLKTSTIDIDSGKTFVNKQNKFPVRTHYAVDFGLQRVATTHGSNRQVNVRQTFNSPFRPFVLATTSIGQEGLDFHLYCKRIVHWNLPSNPIDFEQREGRINRYKGLVIRQIVAEKFKSCEKLATSDIEKIWDALFNLAESEKSKTKNPCDLIPFWHIEPDSNFPIKIERYVPLYPFSKDIEKYKMIQNVLMYYRLTFGQPRQEDIIKTLKKDIEKSEIENFLINLCPLVFNKT